MLLAVKSVAGPSKTTTPFPEKRLFVKHVSEIATLAPCTLARAYPLPLRNSKSNSLFSLDLIK
jgi:hypothetical protein